MRSHSGKVLRGGRSREESKSLSPEKLGDVEARMAAEVQRRPDDEAAYKR